MRLGNLSGFRLVRSKPRTSGTGKSRNKACRFYHGKNENTGIWRTKVSKQSSLAVDAAGIQSEAIDFEPQLKVLVNKRFTNQAAPKVSSQKEATSIKGQIRVSF